VHSKYYTRFQIDRPLRKIRNIRVPRGSIRSFTVYNDTIVPCQVSTYNLQDCQKTIVKLPTFRTRFLHAAMWQFLSVSDGFASAHRSARVVGRLIADSAAFPHRQQLHRSVNLTHWKTLCSMLNTSTWERKMICGSHVTNSFSFIISNGILTRIQLGFFIVYDTNYCAPNSE
jgi:hypothetical protein